MLAAKGLPASKTILTGPIECEDESRYGVVLTFGDNPQALALQREMGWLRTLERTGVTRNDVSTALEAITGSSVTEISQLSMFGSSGVREFGHQRGYRLCSGHQPGATSSRE